MTNVAVFDVLETVHDESSFLRFVEVLLAERRKVEALAPTMDGFQGDWANHSIAMFLDAAHAWALDSSFGERPGPKAANLWRIFADFLYAGRGYE